MTQTRQIFMSLKQIVDAARRYYEGKSIKNQPNLFLGEIDLFFFDVIAL